MSNIFAFVNFSDLDDTNFDYGDAKIPVARIINGVFSKCDDYDNGLVGLLANNKQLSAVLPNGSSLGSWVTFAWNRENEYLIAKAKNVGYLTMHRVGEDYSFTMNRTIYPIIAFLEKYPATIAFTARLVTDQPRVLASRRLSAGAIAMQKTIDDMADGKNVTKLIPNYLKPELSRYLGKLYTLGELSNSNKIIETLKGPPVPYPGQGASPLHPRRIR